MYGGLGRHVEALSAALARQEHDVVVLSAVPDDVPASAADPSSPPQRPRVVRAVLPPDYPDVYADTAGFVAGLQARLVAAADDLLAGWRPDVVHGHDWVVAGCSTTMAETIGRPLVMTVHATESGLYQGNVTSPFSRWRHGVERAMVQRASASIVCSHAMRDEVVQRLEADPRSVVVVPNGVDPSRWRTTEAQREGARLRLDLATEPLLVLVGRLEHEKGAQDAIEALSLLSTRYPTAHLAVVGDGARADDLARQVADAGLTDRVHMLGRLGDDDVAAVVAAADIALVPSRYEPFGLVALEAMASGTAVVAAATGGLTDVVDDGVTGILVPPAQPPALARAVAALLSDRQRRDALVRAASQQVDDRFGWAPVAEATARVYDDVLD